jgi:type VI secretion system protein ImpJ
MFVGVQSTLEPRECIDLLTKPGQLDMKVGSSERVDNLFRHGQAGLRFAPCAHRPRTLPDLPGQIYLQLERSPPSEWQLVQRSLSLALRLNEKLIAGDIQGQRSLTIRVGGQTAKMQFTLYVVGSSAANPT